MREQTTETPTARRHIIKRPRLTRLLDETTARIILLVAPAGYGKTTLAREWCESLRGTIVWYQAGPSAQDVVALAKDLSCALEDFVPGVGGSLRPYLRSLDSGEVDVHALAKRLAADLASWPEDGLLVIDDYQHAVLSNTSDTFLGLVAEQAPLRLLLATRVAPCWASARHFIYGQVLQLERAQLSMTRSEVDQALSRGSPNGVARICALADGWPAVIGLAALTSGTDPPPAALADTLHAYFAQELFDAVDSSLQAPLIKLAALPRITHALAKAALGADPSFLLTEADRVGFLTPRGEAYELHPLLRQFLLGKGSVLDSYEFLAVRKRLLAVLIGDRCWDDAFTLIRESDMISELPGLLRASLDDLLKEGRIATVRSWLEFARSHKLDDPIISLAHSESALRSGELAQARFFATRAYRHLPANDDWIFRALSITGLIAHLADDYARASTYYEKAEAAARSPSEMLEALWGQFIVAFHLESEESENLLQRFESAAGDQTPDDALRVANGRFRTTCLAHTSLRDVLAELSANARLVELASNPHVICGFLVVWAQCSMLTANYSEAIETAHACKEAAKQYDLKFAVPYASGIQSFALFGLRRFVDAQAAVNRLTHEAKALGDLCSLINASVAWARLLLANGDVAEAVAATDDRRLSVATPSMHGELLAVHSLALACAGERRAARASLARARSVSRAIETETTALAAEAVLRSDENALRRLLHHLRRSRHYDAFVAAYRAHPALLMQSAAYSEFRELLNEVICMAGDFEWASSLGIDLSIATATAAYPLLSHQLSPREFEVLGLVAHGLSNNEVARRLYISEATVKVHLRHIFEKLGVRSRTQAALHPAGRRACYATADMRSTFPGGESQ
jgi:LuxR family maltose regulon positive regulatory protein